MAQGADDRDCRLVLFRAAAQLETVLGDLAGFHVLANCRDAGALRQVWQGCRPDLVAGPRDHVARLVGHGFEPAVVVALTGDLRRDLRLACRARRVNRQGVRRSRAALPVGGDDAADGGLREDAGDGRAPQDDPPGVRRYRLRRRPSPAAVPAERAAGPGPEAVRAAEDERARFRHLLFSDLVDPSPAARVPPRTAAVRPEVRRGRDGPLICCVASPKGGVGKTFVAVNLAVALSDRLPTLLLDLDLRAGDASLYLSLGRGASLADLLAAGDLDEPEEIRRHVRRHRRSRLEVLAGSGRPEASELLAPGVVERLLATAARSHAVVVVDTPPASVGDLLCEAAVGATDILLVTGPCPASLRQCSIALGQLSRSGDAPRVLLAANRWRPEGDPDPTEVGAVLGQALAVVVPSDDRAQGAAVLAGEALVRARPRSPAATAVQRLAALLVEQPRHDAETGGDAAGPGRSNCGSRNHPVPGGRGGLAEALRQWVGSILSRTTDRGTRRFEQQ